MTEPTAAVSVSTEPTTASLAAESPVAQRTTPAGHGRPITDSVPRSIQVSAAWSWRLLLILAAAAAVGGLLSYFKVIAVSVAVALLFTVLLSPVATWLRDRARFPRTAASATSVVGLLAVVGGLLTLAGSSIAGGFADLADQAVAGLDTLSAWLSNGPLQLSAAQIEDVTTQISDSVSANTSTLLSGALSVTATLGHVATGALIALFCTLFFLIDGGRVWAWIVGLLPLAAREQTHQAGRRGLIALGAYTRTQILVALVDAIGIGIGAAILQVPLALPLATLVFIGAFIPIVGALVSGSVAVLVALVAQGPVVALAMFAVVLLVQQIEGHVLQPLLMGHAVSLHPVAVILAVAGGTMAAGIVGALFAVPVVAVVNTVVLYLHGHDKYPDLGTEPGLQLHRSS